MRTVRELLSRAHNPSGWTQSDRAFTCNECGKDYEKGSWISSIWKDESLWESLGAPECEDCELSDIDASKLRETLDEWYDVAFGWNGIWYDLTTLSDYTIEWWESWGKTAHKKIVFAEEIADWVLHRTALSRMVALGPPDFSSMNTIFQRYAEVDRTTPNELNMELRDFMLRDLEVGAAAITYLRKEKKVEEWISAHPFVVWFLELQEKRDVPDSGSEKREDPAGVLL